MLETIREFAEERLVASGEAEAVRKQHAAYFMAFAERYELAELLPDGDQVLALLEAEHANLRAALAWLEDTDECGALLRLAAALGRFWTGRGYSHESRDWLERALAHDGAAAADRAKALVALGVIQIYQGANQEAEPRLIEGLAGCRALGDALHAVLALIGLSGLAIMQGNLDRGAALLEEALAAAQGVADRRLAGILAGRVSINLAVAPRAQGAVRAGRRASRRGASPGTGGGVHRWHDPGAGGPRQSGARPGRLRAGAGVVSRSAGIGPEIIPGRAWSPR